MDKTLTLRSFEVLFDRLTSEEQKTFLREHALNIDILLTYNNGCNEITKNFSSMEDLRQFTLNYIEKNCDKKLLDKAQKKYLDAVKNIIDDCPVPNYYDFWKTNIDGKELKDYPLETLFTIINFAYDIGIKESKDLWGRLVSGIKDENISRYEKQERIERLWPKEQEREEMLRHVEEGTIPYIYRRGMSNIWIIHNVSIKSKLFFNEHCILNYMAAY